MGKHSGRVWENATSQEELNLCSVPVICTAGIVAKMSQNSAYSAIPIHIKRGALCSMPSLLKQEGFICHGYLWCCYNDQVCG